MITLARVNWGRWIADCPQCDDAREVTPGQPSMMCAAGHAADIGWPNPAAVVAIGDALARRPDPRNQNWYPTGHPLAVAYGFEQGQTPAQLDAETDVNLAANDQRAARLAQLTALIDQLGIPVEPDGTIRLETLS